MGRRNWWGGIAEEPQVCSSPLVWSRDGGSSQTVCSQGQGQNQFMSPASQTPVSLGTSTGSLNICGMVLWMNEYVFFIPSSTSVAEEGKSWKGGWESLRKWVSRLQGELGPLAPAPAQSRCCFLGGGDVGECV